MEHSIETFSILPADHQLPGLGTLEYIFDRKAAEMTINHDGNEIVSYWGDAARRVFQHVTGFVEDTDPEIFEAEKRAKAAFGRDLNLLPAKTRKREIVEERQIVMWWFKNNTKKSLRAIGSIFGNYDHATVLHAAKTVENLICTDIIFKAKVDDYLKDV